MVNEAVDCGYRHGGIGQYLLLGAEGLIADRDQGRAVVALGDELEEQRVSAWSLLK